MSPLLALFAAAVAQLSIATLALKPADFLDGRAIAGVTGAPVVMLTLTPAAMARISKRGPKTEIRINGAPAIARIGENTVEIDGQPDFEAARKLALDLSGKPPLPDSLDE